MRNDPMNHPTLNYCWHPCASGQPAPTLLLIHGNGLDQRCWEPVLPYLTASFHVLTLDLPGHGGHRDWPDEQPGCDELSHLIIDVIHKLNLDFHRLHLIGHGFGGNLALQVASRTPERIASLTLISTIFHVPASTINKYVSFLRGLFHQEDHRNGREALIQYMLPLVTRHKHNYTRLRNAYEAVNLKLFSHYYDLLSQTNWLQAARRIPCPVLLLSGEHDPIISPYLSVTGSRYLQDAAIVTIPRVSNAVFMDNPAETADRIRDFIGGPSPKVEDAALSEIHSELREHFKQQSSVPHDLEAQLLNDFSIKVNQRTIKDGWNMRNAKHLLVYLIFHKTTTRDKLIETFWPDTDIEKARNQLRVCLNYLKRLLEQGLDTELIKADREQIKLEGNVQCDLNELYQSLARMKRDHDLTQMEPIIHTYAELIISDQYLIGFYHDWVIEFKRVLNSMLLHGIEQLYAHCSERDVRKSKLYLDYLSRL